MSSVTPLRLRKAVEACCWLLGFGLLTSYALARGHGEWQRRAAISTFIQASAEGLSPADLRRATGKASSDSPGAAPPHDRSRTHGAPDQRHWSPTRIREHAASLDAATADASSALALLRISRVGLEVPVFAGTGEHNLNRGAGWVPGTAAPGSEGNVAIAAHRDGYFRVLQDVVVGDVLELDSPSQQRRYRVSALSIVDPSDVSSLQKTPIDSVTLVTCYPFYFVGSAPQRYIVRAVAMR